MLKAWKPIAGGRARHERYHRIERFISLRILKGCQPIYPDTLPILPEYRSIAQMPAQIRNGGAGTPAGVQGLLFR